jgi:hypothetical protein
MNAVLDEGERLFGEVEVRRSDGGVQIHDEDDGGLQ